MGRPELALQQFLEGYRTSPGNLAAPSHTAFGSFRGSYKVPHIDHADLLGKYAEALAAGAQGLCLCERHREQGPVVIDLDYRAKSDDATRRFDEENVEAFVRLYVGALVGWVQMPSEGVEVFVMQRPGARVENGVHKDGVHIVIPDVVTTPLVQRHVREEILEAADNLFSPLGYSNSAKDIVDEAVIEQNGWLMYGSSKPGLPPYDIVRVLLARSGPDGISLRAQPFQEPSDFQGIRRLAGRLSIRTCSVDNLSPLQTYRVAQVHRETMVIDKMRETKRTQQELTPTRNIGEENRTTNENLELARSLVRLLSPQRSEEYAPWMRVAWCLFNIDGRLFPDWVAFSRLSSKFSEERCAEIWSHVLKGDRPLTMGSLHWWARNDDPAGYALVDKAHKVTLVTRAMSGLHHDVAMVLHEMYSDKYVCSSLKHNVWYEFLDHRWRLCDGANTLRAHISGSLHEAIMREVHSLVAEASSQGGSDSGSDSSSSSRSSRSSTSSQESFTSVANKLKTTSFKDAVLKELRELFYNGDFERKLDCAPHLLAFENGVLDLDRKTFRRGRPDDFITLSTGINYIELDDDDPRVQEILTFFQEVHPDEETRTYVLQHLASCLHGGIRDQCFNIWTGVGSNGKSITVELFEKAMGGYAAKVPVSLLTQKRGASAGASPEVARLKGCRFACLQEPGNGEVLNIGLMKELSGGDTIIARGLYRDPVEFKPQFRLIMTANDLPAVPGNDQGTWRRIRVVFYGSRFVEDPNPEAPNQFKVDYSLSSRLSAWAEPFMAMLVRFHQNLAGRSITVPPGVRANTDSYRLANDTMHMFIDTCLETATDESISSSAAYDLYKAFCRNENVETMLKRPDFAKSLQQALNKGEFQNTSYNADIKGVRAKEADNPPGGEMNGSF